MDAEGPPYEAGIEGLAETDAADLTIEPLAIDGLGAKPCPDTGTSDAVRRKTSGPEGVSKLGGTGRDNSAFSQTTPIDVDVGAVQARQANTAPVDLILPRKRKKALPRVGVVTVFQKRPCRARVWKLLLHTESHCEKLLDMTTIWEEMPLFNAPLTPKPLDETQQVFSHWVATVRNSGKGVPPALSDERRRTIRKALALYGLQVCLDAITGCTKSDFHMGRNNRGKRYDDISLILRDAKHIEMFADMAHDKTAAESFLDGDE